MGWSYTKVTSYEGCPFAWSMRYIHGLKQDFGLAAQRGSEMHDVLEKKLPLPSDKEAPDCPTWMLPHIPHLTPYSDGAREERVYLNNKWSLNHPFEDGMYWHISVIDLFKNMGDGTGVVVDYKSGKRRDSHVGQVELYGMSKLCVTNLERIEAKAYYLDEPAGAWGEPAFITRGSMSRIQDDWSRRVEKMEADTTYDPRPNFGCRWCSFARDKGGQCVFSSHDAP